MTVPLERHVRSKDPDTSWQAAEISEQDWSALQKQIVTLLCDHGAMTHDQLIERYRAGGGVRTPQRVRTACRELADKRIIRESNVIGLSNLKNKSQMWELA